MSSNLSHEATLNIFRDKLVELDQLVNQWFASAAKKDGDVDDDSAKLAGCVNDTGTAFHILGGAVGIVNRATNRFEHFKSYPRDNKRTPILPYPQPPATKMSQRLEPLLKERGTDWGIWINKLFEIRREHQNPESTELSRKPESVRASGKLCVVPDEIRSVVQGWIDLLALAAYVSKCIPKANIFTSKLNELESQLPRDFFNSEEFEVFEKGVTLNDCLLILPLSDAFIAQWPDSIEVMFFSKNPDTVREILIQFLGPLELHQIRRYLFCPVRGDRSIYFSEQTIPALLRKLHEANVPIIEYLVLILLWQYELELYHIAWPFFHTLTYHPDDLSEEQFFPGFLLLTFGANPNLKIEDIFKHLSPFFAMMRTALEPFSDVAYYVGIERQRAKLEGGQTTLDDISHEVRQVANALMGCWSIEPDDALKHALNEYFHRMGYQYNPKNARICPEPRLIGAAARITQLWTGSRDPLSFFDSPPKSLGEVMDGLWRVVLDSASGILSRKLRFDDPSDHRSYVELQRRLDSVFLFANVFTIDSDGTLTPPSGDDEDGIKRKWILVFKVLVAKFKDIIRHAHPEKPRNVRVTIDDGCLLVNIANYDRPKRLSTIKDQAVRELYQALQDVRLFTSTGHGNELLDRLRSEGGDFLKTECQRRKNGEYSFQARFNWRTQRNAS